jgi:hypothetical protein
LASKDIFFASAFRRKVARGNDEINGNRKRLLQE